MATQIQDDSAWAKAELEARFSAGPGDALRDAYDRYGALVYSYCRRSVDSAAAAAVTENVFVTCWRSRHHYERTKGGLGPWLLGITRVKLSDLSRPVENDAKRKAKEASPPTNLEDIALRMLLIDAIDDLPEQTRVVTSMAFFEDLNHVEIAARTGLAPTEAADELRESIELLRHGLGYLDG